MLGVIRGRRARSRLIRPSDADLLSSSEPWGRNLDNLWKPLLSTNQNLQC
jgi:hypothetical protein